MNRGFDVALRLAVPGQLIHMDEKRDRIFSRKFLHPTDNEFLRVVIEILLVKRRRIHRVKQLLDSIDEHFDSMLRSLMQFELESSRWALGSKPD